MTVKPYPWPHKAGVCVYCWQRRRLTVDHIQPTSQGGGNDWTNKAPACTKCNSAKGTRGVLQFLVARGGFGRKSAPEVPQHAPARGEDGQSPKVADSKGTSPPDGL